MVLINKIARNFNKVINIWGADHHGYVSRINGAFNIFSNGKSELIILLVQFANLYRGDEKVSMSTRSGDFVTLEQLVKENNQQKEEETIEIQMDGGSSWGD